MFTPVLAKHSKSFSLLDCISEGGADATDFEPMRKQGNGSTPIISDPRQETRSLPHWLAGNLLIAHGEIVHDARPHRRGLPQVVFENMV